MYQITLDHILGDFITKNDELFLSHVFSNLVLHLKINEYLTSSGSTNPMNVLKRVLNPLVTRNLHTSNTSTSDAQTLLLQFRHKGIKVENFSITTIIHTRERERERKRESFEKLLHWERLKLGEQQCCE